ncbi:DUF5020 family protein [Mucilaginibacter segetis]|uniref:DUF5020 family protein n=1 Tax=Mucilaginibacter segetis TaxID=2793071 RepID=A0A934PW27_9SPHI|nr:DUF5020 family protein [Mucilaginibacter segetis]MBK0380727.1 DUF5020 family protein [Mucilaginibacter segetis]
MRYLLILCLLILTTGANAQLLQLHYDARHTLDPERNPKNYATLYFEYFKPAANSDTTFIKRGAFLLKLQADFTGDKANIGKYYMQVSQEVRFWQPKIYLNLQYSGGLGVTEPKQYSYYILNTYSVGVSYPFKWGSAYMSSVLNFKYVPYAKPSKDFLYTLYFYKGLFNYRAEFSGDFSIWTENKDHGDEYTAGLQGKRFFFFAEPQFWYNLNKTIALGTKVNTNYHVLTTDNVLQIYPTAAIRVKL